MTSQIASASEPRAPHSDHAADPRWWGLPIAGYALSAALAITFLSDESSTGSFATPIVKSLAIGVAAMLVAFRHLREEKCGTRATSRITRVALAYGTVVAAGTVVATSEQSQLVALVQFVAVTSVFILFARTSPALALGVLVLTGVIHVVLAAVTHEYVGWRDGGLRLSGGTHPILLGFEAAAVILVLLGSLGIPASKALRVGAVGLALISGWVLIEANSRQALVGAVAGLVLLVVLRGGRWGILRWLAVAVFAVAAIGFVSREYWFSLLGETSASAGELTGRTEIWRALLGAMPQPGWLGFGFGSLGTADGPAGHLYAAADGQPAENALLQVWINSGFLGLAMWIALVGVCIAAILRHRGPVRAAVVSLLPLFAINLAMSSGMSGDGLQWLWLLGVAFAASARVGISPKHEIIQHDRKSERSRYRRGFA